MEQCVDKSKIIVPVDSLMGNVSELIEQGYEVTLRAKGRSMHPYIRNGKDNLIFGPVDVDAVAIGDIILALTSRKDYVVHRIIRIETEEITLMGDGNLYGTEKCKKSDIIGKLNYIERNGKRIDCNTKAQRLKAKMLRSGFRLALKTKNKLKKILSRH